MTSGARRIWVTRASPGAEATAARLEALGKPAPYVDGEIAAIARVNDLILVTANARDFTRFKDLDVENWARRRA